MVDRTAGTDIFDRATRWSVGGNMNWKNASKKLAYLLDPIVKFNKIDKHLAQIVAQAYNQKKAVVISADPPNERWGIADVGDNVHLPDMFQLQINLTPTLNLDDDSLRTGYGVSLGILGDAFSRVGPGKHYVYHVRFGIPGDDERVPAEIDSIIRRGYGGMTSRHPFLRLKEHFSDTRRGSGSLFHRYWATTRELIPETMGIMNVWEVCSTRDDAFDSEEEMVDEFGTKYPGGLNVISGGKKGFRELWECGVGTRNMSATERDIAADRLFGGRSGHYRIPHIRNQWFPREQTHRKIMIAGTYVKPSKPSETPSPAQEG